MSIEKEEQQYLEMVITKVREKISHMTEKMENNVKDMESMHDYFWENYTEFDEYGYEMYDNKQALKVRLTQQEEYSLDAKRYNKMLDSPYFGRVDFRYDGEDEPEIYYIGIANLASGRAAVPLVFDWRAPVSGLFYDYDKGPGEFAAPSGSMKGEIVRKRQYKIRHGRILFALENEMNIDDEILQQTLAEHADAKLKSIVTTIQREQNSIIRDVSHRILAVQGCAGSGKTSVALHRIAYLLYHNREKLNAAQVLVLSPNSIFGDYISRILPELGEENICEMTLDDYAYRELIQFGEAQDRYDEIERRLQSKESEEASYKQSKEYVEELNEFILKLEWEVVDIKEFSYKNMFMKAHKISKLFYEKFCDIPIFARMGHIGEYLIDEEETLRDRNMEDEEKTVILEQLNKMYRVTDAFKLYQQFLEESGREKLKLIQGMIPYEDVYPLLYLKYATQELPKRRAVKHLVIDEMQDYSYLQYLIIQKLFTCPMTILGDKAQTMAEKQQDVLSFLPKIFGKDIYCVSLNKSYRSTWEISSYAASLLDDIAEENESVQRHGEEPKVQNYADEDVMYEALVNQIREQEEMSTIAVLCLDAASASETFTKLKAKMTEEEGAQVTLLHKDSMKFAAGISVMPFYLAKGLEFDVVFVPHVEKYCGSLQRQALYINATRALHVLKLLSVH
jgi:DNA helicase-2/ATP-dependent DNA helicase PcrA